MIVYYYGCRCGLNAKLVRKAFKYADEHDLILELRNSKYSDQFREEHAQYLTGYMDTPAETYEPLLVHDKTIKLLKDL